MRGWRLAGARAGRRRRFDRGGGGGSGGGGRHRGRGLRVLHHVPGAAVVGLVRPVSLERAESDVAISAVSLRFLVQRAVRGGRGARPRSGGRGRRGWYRGRRRGRGVHPHVSVQRDLLVRAVRTVGTSVRLPHLEFVRLLLVLLVGRLLLEPRTMGAVEGAMRLEGARRAEADAAWRADEGSRPGWLHRDRLLAVGWQHEQPTRRDRCNVGPLPLSYVYFCMQFYV